MKFQGLYYSRYNENMFGSIKAAMILKRRESVKQFDKKDMFLEMSDG